jgi:DNA (cytosine-5)-methyltransferase 1
VCRVEGMTKHTNNIVSFFSGAGGLDLGFHKAGFQTIYANEYDKTIYPTFEHNFPNVQLDRRDIRKINPDEIPNSLGFIGGPPCQSWSEAGALRGINDSRGQLFFDYIRLIQAKQPVFFVAENVSGILHSRHKQAFDSILNAFKEIGYDVSYQLLNAKHYNVPQDRQRVFIIGFRQDKKINFAFPKPCEHILSLQDSITDLSDSAIAYSNDNPNNFNHEYYTASFSSMFMSRNRVRQWHEPSFTIQAGGRHAPIHPTAPIMELVGVNKRIFKQGYEHLYRRLSVRECARVQTFPDNFKFLYNNVLNGYKMIGNAVPVNLAFAIASRIKEYL